MNKKNLTQRQETVATSHLDSQQQKSQRLRSALSDTHHSHHENLGGNVYEKLVKQLNMNSTVLAWISKKLTDVSALEQKNRINTFIDKNRKQDGENFAQYLCDNFGLSKWPYEIRRLFAWWISETNPLLAQKGKKKLWETAVKELYHSLMIGQLERSLCKEQISESTEAVPVAEELYMNTRSRTMSNAPLYIHWSISNVTIQIIEPKSWVDTVGYPLMMTIKIDDEYHEVDISDITISWFDPQECVRTILDPMEVSISWYHLSDQYKQLNPTIETKIDYYNKILAIPVRYDLSELGRLQHKKIYKQLSRSEWRKLNELVVSRDIITYIEQNNSIPLLNVSVPWWKKILSKPYNEGEYYNPETAKEGDIDDLRSIDQRASFVQIYMIEQWEDGTYKLVCINKDNIAAGHNHSTKPWEQYGFPSSQVYSTIWRWEQKSFYNGYHVDPYIRWWINTIDDTWVSRDSAWDMKLFLVGNNNPDITAANLAWMPLTPVQKIKTTLNQII